MIQKSAYNIAADQGNDPHFPIAGRRFGFEVIGKIFGIDGEGGR